MSFLSAVAQAADAAPAGGAELGQIILATAGAGVLTTLLLVLGLGHRSGRIGVLDRAGAAASRLTGLPPWAALPTQISSLALICALVRDALGHLAAHRQRP